MQGRDANRVLQRTIKAEERKKRLPRLLARLRQQLDEWDAAHGAGRPFMLGGAAYRTQVLDVIEADFHTMAEMKPPRVRPFYAMARDGWAYAFSGDGYFGTDALLAFRGGGDVLVLLSVGAHLQPEPRKRPGTAGAKPPVAPKPVKVPGAALAAIDMARGTAGAAAARPATAPASRADSSMSASASARPVADEGASAAAPGDTAADDLPVHETPRTCAALCALLDARHVDQIISGSDALNAARSAAQSQALPQGEFAGVCAES